MVLRGVYEEQGDYFLQQDSFEKALKGFSDFVDKTFRAFVKKEEVVVGIGNSDLRVFCRLDIVALEDENKQVGFFVNGVRGMGAGLFLGQSKAEEMVEFSKDIAIALRTWVAIRRSLKEAGEQL